jgi:hypothetical protein
METKMVVHCHEVEVANFFLNWSTPELAAYADKFGVPPQKIFVTVKGIATQLSAYGRLDITTGEVVDNTNHERLFMLWHLFAKGEAVSPEVEMSLEEFEKLVAYSRDFADARLIDSEIDALAENLRLGFPSRKFNSIARAEKIRDSAPSLAARISEAYELEERAKEKENCDAAERLQSYVNQKERIEKFLRANASLIEGDGDGEYIADQYRDGLLSDDDLRGFVRVVLFASVAKDCAARYVPIERDDCPACSDEYCHRDVKFYAEDAKTLSTEFYPALVEFKSRVGKVMPTATCTLRYHQVTCANCDGAVCKKYAVLVSLDWEGMSLSREYDPFSPQ